jgi:hypothetical protein
LREATARARERKHTVSLYAKRRVESTRDYRIGLTAESIEFLLRSIESLGSIYIIKVCLFLLCVPYEWRYRDAKSKSENFLLRNVVIIVVVNRRRQSSSSTNIYMSYVQLKLYTPEGGNSSSRSRKKETVISQLLARVGRVVGMGIARVSM